MKWALKLTRDRLGGSDPTLPLGFCWITSVALQVWTRNLAYLFVCQFDAFLQNFENFSQNFLKYADLCDPRSCHFWSKMDKCLKNRQKWRMKVKCKQKAPDDVELTVSSNWNFGFSKQSFLDSKNEKLRFLCNFWPNQFFSKFSKYRKICCRSMPGHIACWTSGWYVYFWQTYSPKTVSIDDVIF